MANLVKYGKVAHISVQLSDRANTNINYPDEVNRLLEDGWKLIAIKVIKISERAEVHYDLGRKRIKLVIEEAEKSKKILHDLEGGLP